MRRLCVFLTALCGCHSALDAPEPQSAVRRLTASGVPFEVDPQRGVLSVTATDFSNDEGTTRETTLLCGAELVAAWPGLVRDFQVTIDDQPARCTHDTCWAPGWEFGASTLFLLDDHVLISVTRTSVGIGERTMDDEQAWVDASLRDRAKRRCP
ncbi:MAG: hypothetical protein QM817_36865 [Archangium sp.]